MNSSRRIFKQKPTRTLVLFCCLLVAIAGFLVSVFKTASLARHMPASTAKIHNRALRGKIISADGYTMSLSSKTYKATIFTQSLDPDKKELFINLFSIYSKRSPKEIRKIINKHKGYTVLADDIDASAAIDLKSLAYKFRRMNVFKSIKNSRGVNILYGLDIIENGEKRFFPLKDTFAPALGYTNNKDDGKYTEVKGMKGIERRYEKFLDSSNNGLLEGTRDVSSTIIRNKSSISKKRKDGMDVHLNIPLDLQRRVELILDEMKELTQAQEIIAGVMDSHTGKVMALASSDRFDPNHIKKGEEHSLNPKFSEFPYEPGSVMKPITLSIALEHDKVTPDTWFDTSGGKLKISQRYTIKDDHSFESLTATDIIVHSSNVGITKIGWRLSGKQMHEGLGRFGFGHKSGIDLSRELTGKIKNSKQLDNKVNRASQSYGYGMTATFAQLWKAYSTFNNNGIAVTPRIASYLIDSNGAKYHAKLTAKDMRSISKHTASKIKKILKKVVTDGTGKAAIYPGLEVGGKTGTSHIVKNRLYIDKYNSSFFGFINDDKGNKYTIGVLAIKLTKRHMHYASQSAVPTFKKIAASMIELGYLRPDLSVIQKQKMEADEKERQKAIKQKQHQRTREIKAKLKREREEIRRKQRLKKKKNRLKIKRSRTTPHHNAPTHRQERYTPPPRRRPTPHEAVPDLF